MVHPRTIGELTARLSRRELSARETLQGCLDQIHRIDGDLKAFLSLDAADAFAQADAVDREIADGADLTGRPLLGVPIALKDVLCQRGQPANLRSQRLDGGEHVIGRRTRRSVKASSPYRN